MEQDLVPVHRPLAVEGHLGICLVGQVLHRLSGGVGLSLPVGAGVPAGDMVALPVSCLGGQHPAFVVGKLLGDRLRDAVIGVQQQPVGDGAPLGVEGQGGFVGLLQIPDGLAGQIGIPGAVLGGVPSGQGVALAPEAAIGQGRVHAVAQPPPGGGAGAAVGAEGQGVGDGRPLGVQGQLPPGAYGNGGDLLPVVCIQVPAPEEVAGAAGGFQGQAPGGGIGIGVGIFRGLHVHVGDGVGLPVEDHILLG